MTFDQAVEKVQGIMKDANVNDMDSVAIQIHFTNKDCEGTMYISTKNGQIDVQGYDYKDCDAAIELMYGDLTKILTGRLNAKKATISAAKPAAAKTTSKTTAKKTTK